MSLRLQVTDNHLAGSSIERIQFGRYANNQTERSKEEADDETIRGIDLHSNNNVVVLLDEEDRVIYEKRLPNDLVYLLLELAPYRERIEGLVVESTFNWY